MGKDVIIACDFTSKAEAIAFLEKFKDEKPFVKIGMELFYAEGPDIVRTIKGMGHKIFLDLKLHDIPNTVKKAMAVLSGLDVDMCNVHAAGTKGMMQAALEGLTRADGSRSLLIAVTQLTGRAFRGRRCGRSEACDDTCKGKGTRIGLHRSRKTDHTGGGSGSGIPQMCGRICRLGRHTRRGDRRNSLVSSFFS